MNSFSPFNISAWLQENPATMAPTQSGYSRHLTRHPLVGVCWDGSVAQQQGWRDCDCLALADGCSTSPASCTSSRQEEKGNTEGVVSQSLGWNSAPVSLERGHRTTPGYSKAEQAFFLELGTLLVQAKLGSIARQPRVPATGGYSLTPHPPPLPGKQWCLTSLHSHFLFPHQCICITTLISPILKKEENGLVPEPWKIQEKNRGQNDR